MKPLYTVALLLFATAAFADDGTASGKLTVNGKTTPLTHAYALARANTTMLLLSDAVVPDETLWDDFPGLKLALAGKLHAVEVELNADGSVKAAGIAHEAYKGLGYHGTSNPLLKLKTFDAKAIDGSISGTGFSATFHAPLLHRPAPTASGAAGAQTEPGKAVLAFLNVVGSGNKAAIRKLLSADYGKPLDGPNAKIILENWKANHPDPAKMTFTSVHITGNTAEVKMHEGDGGDATFNLVLEGGQWKIDGAMM